MKVLEFFVSSIYVFCFFSFHLSFHYPELHFLFLFCFARGFVFKQPIHNRNVLSLLLILTTYNDTHDLDLVLSVSVLSKLSVWAFSLSLTLEDRHVCSSSVSEVVEDGIFKMVPSDVFFLRVKSRSNTTLFWLQSALPD